MDSLLTAKVHAIVGTSNYILEILIYQQDIKIITT